MKPALTLLAWLSLLHVAVGQGQFYFNNRIGTEVDARFVNPCIDPPGYSSIGSPDWTVQLLGGPIGTPVAALIPLNPSSTGFRGAPGTTAAGYVVGVTVTVPGVPQGANADVLIRLAGPNGVLIDFGPYSVGALGGGVVLPPNLQLGNHPIPFWCPEPATWVLVLCGCVGSALGLRGRSTFGQTHPIDG